MHANPVNRRLLSIAAGLAMTSLVLVGCGSSGSGSSSGSDGASATTAAASVPAAGQEAAAAALADGRTVIDVRTPEEFAQGHIDGAQDIDLRGADFTSQIGALDPKGHYVVYCHSGNRSAQATLEMTTIGLDVVDGGGIGDMQAAGWKLASA